MEQIYIRINNSLYLFFTFVIVLFYWNNFELKADSIDLLTEEYNRKLELQNSEYNLRFGVLFGYGWNYHHTNFKEFPGYSNCCNLFQKGTGSGVNFGGLAQIKLFNQWHFGTSIGYNNLNAFLKNTASEPISVDGVLQKAIIDNVLDCSINTIVLSPYIAYNVLNLRDFFVFAGVDLGIITKANFTQYEQLSSPMFGTFENGYRVRNSVTADLPQKNLLFAGNIGIKYELPLNNNRNLRLVPELKYHYWINSPVGDLKWNTSQITFGIGVLYNAPPSPPAVADPMPPPLPELQLPSSKAIFAVDITHKINNEISQNNDENILVEDFTHTNFKPLLNYIFFDENSATISNRYKQIDKEAMLLNEYRNFAGFNSLETYYYLLDIIGFRLTKHANSNIELIGTNANKGTEKNNTALSQARAEQVKQYLVSKWNIEPHRIKTIARNLPKEPTSPVDASGDEENRRVEIYSTDNRITAPITSFDTITIVKTPSITLVPKVQSSLGINNCKIILSQEKNNIRKQKEIELNNKLSDVVIDLKDTSFANFLSNQTLYYILEAQDKVGKTVSSAQKQIQIERITIASKRENTVSDTDYEYYSLILFEFASRTLDAKHNEIVKYIRTRVKENSKVVVTGYTDIIGQPDVNKRIATERATSTAKRLGVANVDIKGIGADELLYSNEFPEGRFYCRTVTITIETPIIND